MFRSLRGGLLATLIFVSSFSSAAADELRFIRPDREAGASASVVVPDSAWATTGQVLPIDNRGGVADSASGQIKQALDNLERGLKSFDAPMENVVRLSVYLAADEHMGEVQAALAARFPRDRLPAVSYVVTSYADGRVLVSLDAVATILKPVARVEVAGRGQPFPVSLAPSGGRIYIAGQAESSENLAEATRKTLASLRETLAFLGRGDADVMSLKAFVTPIADAATVQAEVETFFGDAPAPPLSIVEWKSSASTPIEIEMVAWGGPAEGAPELEFITPPKMTASPVFSRVARAHGGPTIFVSGLYSPGNAGLADETERASREVRDVFAELGGILAESGSDFKNLAKATYYVSSDSASQSLNQLRPEYYDPQRPPAASKAAVRSVGKPGRTLTLDMIAVPVPRTAAE